MACLRCDDTGIDKRSGQPAPKWAKFKVNLPCDCPEGKKLLNLLVDEGGKAMVEARKKSMKRNRLTPELANMRIY